MAKEAKAVEGIPALKDELTLRLKAGDSERHSLQFIFGGYRTYLVFQNTNGEVNFYFNDFDRRSMPKAVKEALTEVLAAEKLNGQLYDLSKFHLPERLHDIELHRTNTLRVYENMHAVLSDLEKVMEGPRTHEWVAEKLSDAARKGYQTVTLFSPKPQSTGPAPAMDEAKENKPQNPGSSTP